MILSQLALVVRTLRWWAAGASDEVEERFDVALQASDSSRRFHSPAVGPFPVGISGPVTSRWTSTGSRLSAYRGYSAGVKFLDIASRCQSVTLLRKHVDDNHRKA